MSASATLVEPAYRSFPEWFDTAGPEVADLARIVGFGPDPEQEMALDALFAFDAAGRSVAFETAVVCCRQNMKTGLFKQAALGWLFITDQRLVVWSAHEFATAQEAFRDMDELVTGSDLLRKRVKNIYRGNGDESILLTSGARLIFKTRTKGGGRGLSGDKVILDEAFALRPMHMGALLPTLSARPDPQVVYGSSAGLAESDVLRGVRDRGRAQADQRLAYLEWCAEGECADSDCDHGLRRVGCLLDDVGAWHRANPALGRRISAEYVAAERRALPPAEFARERLGWWDRPAADDRPAIDRELWRLVFDPAARVGDVYAWAIATDPERAWSAVAAAGQYGSVADRAMFDAFDLVAHDRGTAWLVSQLTELRGAWGCRRVIVDGGGPAGSLIPDLEAAGFDVIVAGTRDVARAYGLFMDALTDRTVRRGEARPLDEAVRNAKTRPCGDGGQAFGRRLSGVDISPLEAVSLAHSCSVTRPKVNVLNSIW